MVQRDDRQEPRGVLPKHHERILQQPKEERTMKSNNPSTPSQSATVGKRPIPTPQSGKYAEEPSATAKETSSGDADRDDTRQRDASGEPKPGLNYSRHRAAQRAASQAEALRKALVPGFMASALGMDNLFESAGYKLFLENILKDSGDPGDPIERMLIEQLTFAHLRIAQLQSLAGTAKANEAIKLLNSAASRLLGEFRRTALAVRAYRGHLPEGKSVEKLKIYKMAQ
jgi:hypothetical protein